METTTVMNANEIPDTIRLIVQNHNQRFIFALSPG